MSFEGKKYFFDINNFDQPTGPKIDPDLPPPPPLFTLEELGQAKDEAYAQGHAAGIEKEKQSRGHYIAAQVGELNNEIRGLILSEQMREKRFEREVIDLCRSLIIKLFPRLNDKHGLEEIEDVIARIVSHSMTTRMIIEVPSTDLEEVTHHLSTLKDIKQEHLDVRGTEDLKAGSCRMKWENGGAVRDPETILARIMEELDDLLAPNPQKGHNSESEILPSQDEDGE